MESLLKDYYLDVYYLEKVKNVIAKHAKQEDLLKKYKQNKNEAEYIDKKTKTIDEDESTVVDEEAG